MGITIQSGQVELVCTEQWWENETPGAGQQGRLEIRSGPCHRLVQSFIGETEFTSDEPVVRFARFQIPKDAPPTVHGSVAQVSWELTGRLEMESGNPVTQSLEVTIATSPGVRARRSAAALSEESSFTGCTLAMVLVNDVVGAGGYLEGELRARMHGTDQALDIRMELHSVESAGDRQAESLQDRVSLDSDVQLTSAEPYVWAFSLPVPKQTLPTVKSAHTTVSWHLKAVVDTDQTTNAYYVEREVRIFTST